MAVFKQRKLFFLMCLSSLATFARSQFINTIRIQHPPPANPSTTQFITLCEVEVFNGAGFQFTLTNATQSTTRVGPEGPNVADWAIDGDTSSNFNDFSCTHTAGGADNEPFWTALFETTQPLGTVSVVIYNRNVLQGRLGGAVVSINSVPIATLGNPGQNPDTDGDDIITVGATGTPTRSPTTSEPTTAPSQSPTTTPTGTPTKAPTTSPTLSPTEHPTFMPTFLPTDNPSPKPTASPTIPDDGLGFLLIVGPAAGGGVLLLVLAVVLFMRRRRTRAMRKPVEPKVDMRMSAMYDPAKEGARVDIKNPLFAGDSDVESRSRGSSGATSKFSGITGSLSTPPVQPMAALQRVANRESLKGTTIPKYSELQMQEQVKKSTRKMVVIEDFKAEYDDELSATQGTVLTITSKLNDEWYHAYDPRSGKSGIIPANFLQTF